MNQRPMKRTFHKLKPGKKLDLAATIRIVRDATRKTPEIYKGKESARALFGIRSFGYGIFAKVVANEAVKSLKMLNPKQQRELARLLANKIYLENKARELASHNIPTNIITEPEHMEFFGKELEKSERKYPWANEDLEKFIKEIKLDEGGLKTLNSAVKDAEELIKYAIGIELKRAHK